MTTEQVAKHLGLTKSQVLKMVKQLGMKPIRIPNRQQRYFFRSVELVILDHLLVAEKIYAIELARLRHAAKFWQVNPIQKRYSK